MQEFDFEKLMQRQAGLVKKLDGIAQKGHWKVAYDKLRDFHEDMMKMMIDLYQIHTDYVKEHP